MKQRWIPALHQPGEFANTWITQQMEDLRQKVATAEARLQAYQASEKMVDTEKSQGLLTSRLSALNEVYTVEQNKVSALANRYGPKHPSLIAAKEAVRELEKRRQAEKKT